MSTKNKIILVLVVLALMALQYFFGPKKVEYKERIKLVEVVKEQVRTTTQKIKRPDGTTIETTIVDQIKENKTLKQKDVVKKVTPVKKDWFVTGTYSLDQTYSLSVQRRVIFDLYAGIYARSDKEIGIAVSYSF